MRVLITEAHDDMGLALTRLYLADESNQIVAFCGDIRKGVKLRELAANTPEKQLLVIDVELSNEESVCSCAEQIEDFVDALDLVIYNPGFIFDDYLDDMEISFEIMKKYADVMQVAHKWLIQSVFELVKKGEHSRFFAIYPYLRRNEFTLSDSIYVAISFLDHFHPYIKSTAESIDPKFVTFYDDTDSSLLKEIIGQVQFDAIGIRWVLDKQILNRKVKAIFETISKLPHGKHLVRTTTYTI